MLILGDETHVCDSPVIVGQALGVPIVQHGPFVMNTKDEIFQAIIEFREGHLDDAK